MREPLDFPRPRLHQAALAHEGEDPLELERILAFVRKGGLMQARAREVERLAHEAEVAQAQILAGPSSFDREPAARGPEIDLLGALKWLGRLAS